MPVPPPEPTLDVSELSRRLQAREPAVRIVRERHLRKVLHRLADDGAPLTVNTDLPLWIERARLLEVWSGPDPITDDGGERYLLVSAPDDRLPDPLPAPHVLLVYWRLLFRGAVAKALGKRVESGDLTPAAATERLDALGEAVRLELRYVLESDHVVPYGADDLALYLAAVPLLADLDFFEPLNLRWVFPSLEEQRLRDDALEETGLPFEALRAATRPDGAGDPDLAIPLKVDQRWDVSPDLELVSEPTSGKTGLLARAVRMARRGNAVRAAILRVRAAQQDEAGRAEILKLARSAIEDRLVKRLAVKDLLDLDYQEQKLWTAALDPLLEPAARGLWPRAARALYDLQRIVTDLQGEIATVDPIEWVRSWFRRPLRRTLTRARDVILLRHLSTARKHLLRTSIDPADRDRLDHLLAAEVHKVEARVRMQFEPVVVAVLDEVGLAPRTKPERIARDKVVAELLDRVCERGFLRIGDLRDAIARNQLKMPDLQGPVEFLTGDPLLRADARLAVELDGVYRRGEFYLRWIQRGTAAAFGTPLGRWLSKYVAFPFLGAFLVVEFAKYLAMEAGKVYAFFHRTIPPEHDRDVWFEPVGPDFVGPPEPGVFPPIDAALPPPGAHHGVAFTPESAAVTVALGFVILGLLYWPAFRTVVLAALRRVWRGVRFAVVGLPVVVWRSPPVKWLRQNPATRYALRHLGSAVLVAAYVAVLLFLLGAGPSRLMRWTGISFAAAALVANTTLGRRWEDNAAEAFSDTWRTIRVNLVPGLVSWVVWGFRELIGLVERGLYAVDEWFRFRQGQSGGSLLVKVVLALVWFPIAYVIRFSFNLLLEPQINPVKHFPVVTVSHKLLLPMIPGVAESTGLSIETSTALIAGVPGIFGFVVWELKENWRLYAANRAGRLTPVVLGHHGETMRGLLRPGFHSGTVPSLYRKLRQAARKQSLSTGPVVAGQLVHGLEEVSHAVELFVHRELEPLLRTGGPDALTVRCEEVHVDVQTIEVALGEERFGKPYLRLAFDHSEGQITARLVDPGWTAKVNPEQATALRFALEGFCRMANAAPPAEWATASADGPTWDEWEAFWNRADRAG